MTKPLPDRLQRIHADNIARIRRTLERHDQERRQRELSLGPARRRGIAFSLRRLIPWL